MSSPFQSAFMARSPLAELSAKQKANLSSEHKVAILTTQNETPSPLGKHGDEEIKEAKKLSKQGDSDGDFDYSNEKVVALKNSGQKKNATHTEEKVTPVVTKKKLPAPETSKDQNEKQNLKDEDAARDAAARS